MKRVKIDFNGIVQGVGFRPYLAKLAHRHHLTGRVLNHSDGVTVWLQGDSKDVLAFQHDVSKEAPPLAHIEVMEVVDVAVVTGETDFRIVASAEAKQANTLIAADTAPCAACLQEMQTPGNIRYQYPFINCTHCGPRYSIIEQVPYDRQYTSMKSFSMCELCENEYHTLENRRFHAEPTACPTCGPHYSLEPAGCTLSDQEVIEETRKRIRNGQIGLIKGIGGYHYVCDATCQVSVDKLRALKKRPTKPLAVMVGSLARIKELCEVTPAEEAELVSPARPIVLLRRKSVAMSALADTLTFQTEYLGCMLPYSPFHALLLEPHDIWVMTSANDKGDPVVYRDDLARQELAQRVDFTVSHSRTIVAPVDDSVLRVVREQPLMMRRARGYVPLPFYFSNKKVGGPQILATGSDLKNTFTLVKEGAAFMSPHIGNLESGAVYQRYEDIIGHMKQLFGVTPTMIVSDKHPNYFSTQFGQALSQQLGIPLWQVQHHHAHVGAVLAEHKVTTPVIAIVLDGTGYGLDGNIWGGELLKVSSTQFTRLGHSEYVPLPGGEMAVREPWRQGLWYLQHIYGKVWPSSLMEWRSHLPKGWEWLYEALNQGQFPMVKASSIGRLFDVVGCLLGLGYRHDYDGQIAMAVEQLAGNVKGDLFPYAVIPEGNEEVLSFTPTIESICERIQHRERPETLAASFHKTLAMAFVAQARKYCEREGIRTVVLAGGVFQNKRLLEEIYRIWPTGHFLIGREVPPNDGGLSLGQAWLAWQQEG